MTSGPVDLLARPAAQSVRLIAQGYLDTAVQALERLDDPADAEALHDFRVALRRLRTTLRAYRPLFEDSLGKKPSKQLGKIADSTNRVREAEAALEWLRPLTTGLTPGERVGLAWLIERIELRRVKDTERCLTGVRRSFGAVTRKLQKGLGAYRQTVGPEPTVTDLSFAGALTAAALEQAGELDRLLGTVRHIEDDAAHQARIAAKRLRYVLEPVVTALAGADALIDRLKKLQDLIGELHDLQELEVALRAAVGVAAAERAEQLLEATLTDAAPAGRPTRRRGRHAGLVAVGKRMRIREHELFEALRTEWLGSHRTWARDVAALLPPAGPVARVVPVPVAAPDVRRWSGRRPA